MINGRIAFLGSTMKNVSLRCSLARKPHPFSPDLPLQTDVGIVPQIRP
jgi:hypothetical protein